MSEHSPTPWRVEPDERAGVSRYAGPEAVEIVGWNIHAADGAELVGCEGILGDGEHIAKQIVHAVNLHDEMVEALQDLIREMPVEMDPLQKRAVRKAEAVLAKASSTPRKVPDPTGSER